MTFSPGVPLSKLAPSLAGSGCKAALGSMRTASGWRGTVPVTTTVPSAGAGSLACARFSFSACEASAAQAALTASASGSTAHGATSE